MRVLHYIGWSWTANKSGYKSLVHNGQNLGGNFTLHSEHACALLMLAGRETPHFAGTGAEVYT